MRLKVAARRPSSSWLPTGTLASWPSASLPAAASSSEIGKVIDRAMRHVASTTRPSPNTPITAIAISSGR